MFIINKATYGGADVTNKVRSLVKDNKLIVKASNDIFGDTNSGTVKYLKIGSSEGLFSVKENGYISLPKDETFLLYPFGPHCLF